VECQCCALTTASLALPVTARKFCSKHCWSSCVLHSLRYLIFFTIYVSSLLTSECAGVLNGVLIPVLNAGYHKVALWLTTSERHQYVLRRAFLLCGTVTFFPPCRGTGLTKRMKIRSCSNSFAFSSSGVRRVHPGRAPFRRVYRCCRHGAAPTAPCSGLVLFSRT
jgi:hypothetical protein